MGQASLGFWYQVFGDEESKFILSFFFYALRSTIFQICILSFYLLPYQKTGGCE
jgi:hypothetical protein